MMTPQPQIQKLNRGPLPVPKPCSDKRSVTVQLVYRARGLRRPHRLQEACQFRRRLILRNRVQFLEGAGKRVGQAPHRPRLELLMNRLEIEVVYSPCQMLRE